MTVKAIGYARVVPLDTSDDALAHQAQRIAVYCKSHDLELLQVFKETSAATSTLAQSREILKQALMAVPENGALVVVRVDRLGLSRSALKEIREKCNERRITVHAMDGPVDLSRLKLQIEVIASM